MSYTSPIIILLITSLLLSCGKRQGKDVNILTGERTICEDCQKVLAEEVTVETFPDDSVIAVGSEFKSVNKNTLDNKVYEWERVRVKLSLCDSCREERSRKEKINKEALEKMNIQHDDIRQITWYKDKSINDYVNIPNFCLYISNSSLGLALHLKINFVGDHWIFIEKYYVKADERVFEINPGEIERDIIYGYGRIYEEYDTILASSISNFFKEEEKIEMIRAIIEAKEAKLRYVGKQRHFERIIIEKEKLALKNVLNAYESLGGQL